MAKQNNKADQAIMLACFLCLFHQYFIHSKFEIYKFQTQTINDRNQSPNMSAFIIFDPKNNLIFSHCDQRFRQILLLQISNDSNDDNDDDENVHNWLSIYLTPYVSMFRESNQNDTDDGHDHDHVNHDQVNDRHHRQLHHFDQIPNTIIVQQNYREFIFMYLVCQQDHQQVSKIKDDEDDDQEQRLLRHYQLKVNLFCSTTLFLSGNSIYLTGRNLSIQKTLLAMLTEWERNHQQISFMIESIEKLNVGYHIDQLCGHLSFRLEHVLKLLNDNHYQRHHQPQQIREMFSFCFIIYRDKLIYKYESFTRVKLKPADLSMIMLLSSIESSSTKHDDNSTLRPSSIESQRLIFLQSSTSSSSASSYVLIPHVYRKISITKHLYIICLSELTSLLLISLSSLMNSIFDHRMKIIDKQLWRRDSRKSIDYLIKCIKSMDKYMCRNIFDETLQQRQQRQQHLFNMNSLENLDRLARQVDCNNDNQHSNNNNVHNRINHNTSQLNINNNNQLLIREQTDRIFSALLDNLHQTYEKVFKTLHNQIDDYDNRNYSTIIVQYKSQLNQSIKSNQSIRIQMENLRNCMEFIKLKYSNNISLFDYLHGLQIHRNLLAFLLINRDDNYYIKDYRQHLTADHQDINELFNHLLCDAYGKHLAEQSNCKLIYWQHHSKYYFVYTYWSYPPPPSSSSVRRFSFNENSSKSSINTRKYSQISLTGSMISQKLNDQTSTNGYWIDEWLQNRNICKEFFAIFDRDQCAFVTDDEWLRYLSNIVAKIEDYIH